jgi:hypothetical protein
MKNLLSIVVIVLVLVVVLQRTGCSSIPGFERPKSDTTVLHDTSWSVHDTTIYKTLVGKGKTLHDTIATPPEYIADTNYPKLLIQYNDLLKKYMALVEFRDTVRIDTLGYVAILDTVNQNAIKGRSIISNYKIPFVTKTVTINNYAIPKTQLYVGGGIGINKTLGVTGVQVGAMLKTKKDQLFGLNVGSTIDGSVNYGFNSYWKIKLR